MRKEKKSSDSVSRKEFQSAVKKIDQRFEKIDQRFEKIDQRFEKIDQRFEKIDQRFEKIDQRFDAMDKKIDLKFEEAKRYMGVLYENMLHKLDLIIERVSPTIDQVARHEERLVTLETDVEMLKDQQRLRT